MDGKKNLGITAKDVVATTTISICAAAMCLEQLISHTPREPYINRDEERIKYFESLISDRKDIKLHNLRMSRRPFLELCTLLKDRMILKSTLHVCIEQQVAMFLHILGHNVRFRVIGARFFRSNETVSRYFHEVLRAILELQNEFIKSPTSETPPEIQHNGRYWPWFKDCIGAIDGNHVQASVPLEIQGRFRGRKDKPTQNIMAAVSFDMRFTYILAGWEGSVNDTLILEDALTRPNGLIVPEGKYFLVDAGYGIRKGFIPPYRATKYHLKEYSKHQPKNAKELYNLRHSSLITTVERAFGVLKKRFRVLTSEPHWSYKTQVDVVIACCILHNYLLGVDPEDNIFSETQEYQVEEQRQRQKKTQRQRRKEINQWKVKRNEIANAMYTSYRNV